MSTHFEWLTAASTSVSFLPDGYDVATGDLSDPQVGEVEHMVDAGGAVLLSEDEVVVLHGTPDELRGLATRILRSLPGSRE